MGLDHDLPLGSTPLTEEDAKGLLIESVLNRETLNLVEAENITKAKTYFLTHRKKYSDLDYLFSDICVRDVHQRMFGEVWSWAGSYRSHDTSIGFPFEQVAAATRNLMLNLRERVRHVDDSAEEIDMLAIQLHFELVSIHPFPNGNGRHTRQMADLLLAALARPPFSWNETALIRDTDVRRSYIAAIEHAYAYDTKGDLTPLLQFARS